MRRQPSLIAFAGSIALAGIATAQIHEDFALRASDGKPSDHFGYAAAASGDRVLIGAPREDHASMHDIGAAYLFERDAGGAWHQVFKFRPDDGQANDWFGSAVALFGDWAVVGAPRDDDNGDENGSAYLFERQPNGAWEQRWKFLANDGPAGEWFGLAVSLWGAGEYILVGGGASAQAVYVFERVGMDTWGEAARLVPSEPDPVFGSSVSIYGRRAIVGSHGNDGLGLDAGAAFVFERDQLGAWNERAVIRSSSLDAGDAFGSTVALHGNRVLIGAREDDDYVCCQGAAYVFERDSNDDWIETAKLFGSSYAFFGDFGASLALSGDRCVVGDPYVPLPGAATVFERSSAGAWSQVGVLEGSDSQDYEEFAGSLAIAGDRVIAGRREWAYSGTGSAFGYELGVGDTYCRSTANSTGAPAVLASVGSASVSANELSLTASPVPLGNGIFFLGPTQASVVFGNGTLCVGGSLVRTPVVSVESHVLSQRMDLGAPPLVGNVVAGSLWNFQTWFRDPPAGGEYFNTSSALSILFVP